MGRDSGDASSPSSSGQSLRKPKYKFQKSFRVRTCNDTSIKLRCRVKSYVADPLVCQRCGDGVRVIACIDQPHAIENILTHLGLWPHSTHVPPMLLNYQWFQKTAWQKEIKRLLSSGLKYELDALANKDFQYLTKKYLLRKLKETEWLD